MTQPTDAQALVERFEAFVTRSIVERDAELLRVRAERDDAEERHRAATESLLRTQSELIAAQRELSVHTARQAEQERRNASSVLRGQDYEAQMFEWLRALLAEWLPDAACEDTHATPHAADATVSVPLPAWFGRAPLRFLVDWKHYSTASVKTEHLSKLARDCVAQGADGGVLVYSTLPPSAKGFVDVEVEPHRVEETTRFAFARLVVCDEARLQRALAVLMTRSSPAPPPAGPRDDDVAQLLELIGSYQQHTQDMMDVLYGSFSSKRFEQARSETSLALKKVKRKLNESALVEYAPQKQQLHAVLHRMNTRDIIGPKNPTGPRGPAAEGPRP